MIRLHDDDFKGYGVKSASENMLKFLNKIHKSFQRIHSDERSFSEMFKIQLKDFTEKKLDLSSWIINNYPDLPRYKVPRQAKQCMFCGHQPYYDNLIHCHNVGYLCCPKCVAPGSGFSTADPERYAENSKGNSVMYHPELLPMTAKFYSPGRFSIQTIENKGGSFSKMTKMLPGMNYKGLQKLQGDDSHIAIVSNLLDIEEAKQNRGNSKILTNSSLLKENFKVELLLFNNRLDTVPAHTIALIKGGRAVITKDGFKDGNKNPVPGEDNNSGYLYSKKIELNEAKSVNLGASKFKKFEVGFEDQKMFRDFEAVINDLKSYAEGDDNTRQFVANRYTVRKKRK